MARVSSSMPLYVGQLKSTPLGTLWLAASQVGLVAVGWARNELLFAEYLTRRYKRPLEIDHSNFLAIARDEIKQYLYGNLRQFSFPVDWSLMRPFQQAVLQATISIPYGETRSYSEIALVVNRPRAARAVGRAEATNPMPLVIPCHRVIGMDGKLHGYGGGKGLPTKEWLLKMEGALMT